MNTWSMLALVIGLIHLAAFLVLAGCALRAPAGYEDSEGFHTGTVSLPDPQPIQHEHAA